MRAFASKAVGEPAPRQADELEPEEPELEELLEELELDELELEELELLELLEDELELDELDDSELELEEPAGSGLAFELGVVELSSERSGDVAVSLQPSRGAIPAATTPPLNIFRNSRRSSRSLFASTGTGLSLFLRSITVSPVWCWVVGVPARSNRSNIAPPLRRSTTRSVVRLHRR